MITCLCCGTWRLEWLELDRLDGRGSKLLWRIKHWRESDRVWADWLEYEDMDSAVAELVRRGIRIFD